MSTGLTWKAYSVVSHSITHVLVYTSTNCLLFTTSNSIVCYQKRDYEKFEKRGNLKHISTNCFSVCFQRLYGLCLCLDIINPFQPKLDVCTLPSHNLILINSIDFSTLSLAFQSLKISCGKQNKKALQKNCPINKWYGYLE